MESTKLVILLCGIPGSGKSTFARLLQNRLELESIRATIISFDDISFQMDWDETSFKRSRAQTLQILNDTLSSLEDKDNVSSILAREVVIVDDIMHLRSMRRQVYQIARDHEVPLLTLWINTCNDTARARNSQRPEGKHRVVEEAFEKIVRDFQPPNIEHICDRTFLEIVPSSSTDAEVIQTSFQEILKQFDVKKESMNPRPNLATTNNACALSVPNDIKLADECIRKLVARIMRAYTASSVPQLPPQLLSQYLSQCKAAALERARSLRADNFSETETVRLYRESLREKLVGLDDVDLVTRIIDEIS